MNWKPRFLRLFKEAKGAIVLAGFFLTRTPSVTKHALCCSRAGGLQPIGAVTGLPFRVQLHPKSAGGFREGGRQTAPAAHVS